MEKKNSLIKGYIIVLIVLMIIFQVILIYSILLDMKREDVSDLSKEVVVESMEPKKITLVGILMTGTGYLFFIKERFTEETTEKGNCMIEVEDNMAASEKAD